MPHRAPRKRAGAPRKGPLACASKTRDDGGLVSAAPGAPHGKAPDSAQGKAPDAAREDVAVDFTELTALPRAAGITAARRAELAEALRCRLGAAKDGRASSQPAHMMSSIGKWGAGATMAQAGVTAARLNAVTAAGSRGNGGGRSGRAIERATGVSGTAVRGILAGASARRAARRAAARAEEPAVDAARLAERNVAAAGVLFDESLIE